MSKYSSTVLLACLCGVFAAVAAAAPAKAPEAVWERLAQGEKVRLVVVFNDSAINAEVEKKKMQQRQRGAEDEAGLQHLRQTRLAAIKKQALSRVPAKQIEALDQYDALPMMFLQFHSARGLRALLAQKIIINVYEDQEVHLAK